jgi:hypothetical protein
VALGLTQLDLPEFRLLHSGLLEVLGDVQMTQGEWEGAREAYEAARGILEALAKADPMNATLQRGVSTSLIKLGSAQMEEGDWEGARQSIGASIVLRQSLAKAHSKDDFEWLLCQRDLSWSFEMLGVLAHRHGHLPLARRHLRRARSIVQRLLAFNPQNFAWRDDFARIAARLAAIDASR